MKQTLCAQTVKTSQALTEHGHLRGLVPDKSSDPHECELQCLETLAIVALEHAAEDARQFDAFGMPTEEAREAREWLAYTTGTRRFEPWSADYCLHLAEDEIRWRVHHRFGRLRSAEEYRQRLLAEVDEAWASAPIRTSELSQKSLKFETLLLLN